MLRGGLRLCLALGGFLAPGCVWLAPSPAPTPSLPPMPTAWPTPTPEPADTGWQTLRPGVELRLVRLEVHVAGQSGMDSAERLILVRLEPATVRFRVRYAPGAPLTVRQWAEQVRPLLLVNGGYFTPENETVGLLISDGRAWGAFYGDFAGLFAVTPDGRASVRWLREWPYDPSEPLAQAVMSFPVLVKPGGVMGFPAEADDGAVARRTVVAQDFDGRILFIVAPRGYLSLHGMASFLAESDLGIDTALNLDGGFSTGLWLHVGEVSVEIDSLVGVPAVITVEEGAGGG